MEFKLFYKGKLNSHPTPEHKHKKRLHFHNQLLELFDLPPLNNHRSWLKNKKLATRLRDSSKNFLYLVSEKLEQYVELDVVFLIPKQSRNFKDIDNKLKGLCDALTIPRTSKSKDLASRPPLKKPLICLLQDDSLIYKLNIDTDYLLDNSVSNKGEVLIVITVKIKGNKFDSFYNDLII